MTNRAMPGIVKIGFSTKDPCLRARELDGTGVPHPFVVAYDALVEEPYAVEQRVHVLLRQSREAKEFFKVTVDFAIKAINAALEDQNKGILLSSSVGHNSSGFSLTNSIKGRTASCAGFCEKCGQHFSITITRHENKITCPVCFFKNDVSNIIGSAFKF